MSLIGVVANLCHTCIICWTKDSGYEIVDLNVALTGSGWVGS